MSADAALIDWRAVAVLIALVGAWSTLLLWAVNRIVATSAGNWQAIAAAVGDLSVKLPEEYVRREDWIRFGGAIDAKMDRLHEKLDRLNNEAP